jgi:hypothetical protein
MIRCPIVLKRVSWEEAIGKIVYRGQPSRRSPPGDGTARWDVLSFIACVVDHIPGPSQQMVRYWGWYSNAARGKRRRAAGSQGVYGPADTAAESEDPFRQRARLTLLCPICGAQMRILAFITDFAAARAIRRSLELPAQEPEPLAHALPQWSEPRLESA